MPLLDMVLDGAFASTCATLVSNPFDVLRTRMQLQGQLKRAGEYEVLYKNLFQGIAKIVREEGLLSLEKGLAPAVLSQITLNGIRIGSYPLVKEELGRALDAVQDAYAALRFRGQPQDAFTPLSESSSFLTSVLSGAICGLVGSVVASPFIMVKTRLQSQHGPPLPPTQPCAGTTCARVPVESLTGTQFRYRGIVDAFCKIYSKGGLRGLWHGAGVAAQRTMVGSAVQLTAYDYSRLQLAALFDLPVSDPRMHVLAAVCTSFCVVLFMNPFDVVMTRSYNTRIADQAQRAAGVNTVSNNIFREVLRIYRVEGVMGLYKGSVALFSRSAPHNIATFVVLEWVRRMREYYTPDRAYTQGSSMKKSGAGGANGGRARGGEAAAAAAPAVTGTIPVTALRTTA